MFVVLSGSPLYDNYCDLNIVVPKFVSDKLNYSGYSHLHFRYRFKFCTTLWKWQFVTNRLSFHRCAHSIFSLMKERNVSPYVPLECFTSRDYASMLLAACKTIELKFPVCMVGLQAIITGIFLQLNVYLSLFIYITKLLLLAITRTQVFFGFVHV